MCQNPVGSNVSLAQETEAITMSEVNWFKSNICTNSDYTKYIFGPAVNKGKNCVSFNSDKPEFGIHDCSHVESHHAIICKYT